VLYPCVFDYLLLFATVWWFFKFDKGSSSLLPENFSFPLPTTFWFDLLIGSPVGNFRWIAAAF